jgi:hypothetical protein
MIFMAHKAGFGSIPDLERHVKKHGIESLNDYFIAQTYWK